MSFLGNQFEFFAFSFENGNFFRRALSYPSHHIAPLHGAKPVAWGAEDMFPIHHLQLRACVKQIGTTTALDPQLSVAPAKTEFSA